MWLQVEGVRGVICFPLRACINPYIFCSSHICFPVFPLTNGTLILTDCRSHWWCILASRHPGILASWWMRPCDDGNCQQLQFSCVCQSQMTIGGISGVAENPRGTGNTGIFGNYMLETNQSIEMEPLTLAFQWSPQIEMGTETEGPKKRCIENE